MILKKEPNQISIKNKIIDYFMVFIISVILVVMFLLYFYNVFIKFQIKYSSLHNQIVISKAGLLQDDLVKVSNTIFSNKIFNDFILNKNKKILDMEELNNVFGSSYYKDYISGIITLIPNKEIVYMKSSYFNDKFTFNEFKNLYPEYSEIAENSQNIITSVPFKENSSSYYFTAPYHENYIIYVYKDYNNRIIMLFISGKQLKDYLNEHVYPISYETILINSSNEILIEDTKFVSDDLVNIIKVLDKNATKIQNNYLLIKNSSNVLSCVSIIKISDILNEAVKTSSFLIMFSFLILSILFTITYLFYFKQKNLISLNKNLNLRFNNMKVDLIIQKAFSCEMLSKNDLAAVNEYLSLKDGNYLIAMIIGITNYDEFILNNDINDAKLKKYGFENIICEVLEKLGNIKIVNIGKDLIGLIIYNNTPFEKKLLIKNISYYQDIILKNFNTHLFTVIGKLYEDFMSITDEIPLLINAQQYKLIKDNQSSVFFEDIPKAKNDKYPKNIQEEVIDALNKGNIQQYKDGIVKFSNYIETSDYNNVKEWCLKLIISITELSNPNIHIIPNTLENIILCNKYSDIMNIFYNSVKYIHPPEDSLANIETSDNTFKLNVIKAIEMEFSNPDFGIPTLVELLNISSPYFGKKFKKEFNTTFNKYLLEYRINYAIKLLKETNYTNVKISKMCGFSSEIYFSSIFKKNLGVTPKELKSKMLSKDLLLHNLK